MCVDNLECILYYISGFTYKRWEYSRTNSWRCQSGGSQEEVCCGNSRADI